MACKKSDLVTAVNSYAAAKNTGDATLFNLSVNLLQNLIDTLEFEEEEVAAPDTAPVATETKE